MPEDRSPIRETATGCVVFLIDEGDAMQSVVAGAAQSRAETVASALNALLNHLTAASGLEVAVVGYRGDGRGGAEIGCRWGGPLGARRLVLASELADAPLAVEQHTRRVPVPDGTMREVTVPFPVWYVPQLGTPVFPLVGFGYCRQLLATRVAAGARWRKPPLLVSFVGEWLSQTSRDEVARVMALSCPSGPPLVVHAHLATSTRVAPSLCPAMDAYLPAGAARELFACASVLPPFMLEELRRAALPVAPEARGLVYNARASDLARFLSVVKAYAALPEILNTTG